MRTRTILLASLALVSSAAVVAFAATKQSEPHPTPPDIVDTAVAAGDFTTLATALKSAGLVDALKGEGPFTVFAPTDAAFAKLPEGTVEALLKDKEKLTAILTYHVVPGKVTAADAKKVSSAKTLQGQSLAVETTCCGQVSVGGANVVKADIHASNGVIHVIDRVLLPK